MPEPGAQIQAGDNIYVVTSVDTLKESIHMRLKERTVEIFKSDLEILPGEKYILKKEIVTKIEHAEDDAAEEDTYKL
jgi:hypothetical protein